MRSTFPCLLALTAACSCPTTRAPFIPGVIEWGIPRFFMVDTDGDGTPNQWVPGGATFIDTDDDGLPDTRVDGYWARLGSAACNDVGLTAIRAAFARLELASDATQATNALDWLATAVAKTQGMAGAR